MLRLVPVICLLLLSGQARADFADPLWPCVQRKVSRLSPGLMWPHPIAERDIAQKSTERIEALAGQLALRRISLDEAGLLIDGFVADTGKQELAAVLGQVFVRALERLDADRHRIVEAIGRYAREQSAMALKIKQAQAEMNEQAKAASPDFDRMDALEEQIDWNRQIYRDREQSLNYICETPSIIEKRAFALAQALLAHYPD